MPSAALTCTPTSRRPRRPRRKPRCGVNRRSDQPLLDAFDALFAESRLGHEDIIYRRVRAAPAHETSRLRGAHADAALRIRIVPPRRAGDRADQLRVRQGPVGPCACRTRPRRRRRAAAVLGRDTRASRARRRADRHRADLPAAHRGARAHARQRGPGVRATEARAGPGGDQRRRQRVRRPSRRGRGCACSRRSSDRRRRSGRGPPPRRRSSVGAASGSPPRPRRNGRQVHQRLHGWARVAREQRGRRAHRGDHGRRGPCRAGARRDRRRAAADRPAVTSRSSCTAPPRPSGSA